MESKREKPLLAAIIVLLLVLPLCGHAMSLVDLSAYQAASTVVVSNVNPAALAATWTDKAGAKYQVVFNLTPGQPLLQSLATAPASGGKFSVVAENVDAKYRMTFGTRRVQAGWPYIFFDKVPENQPTPVSYLSTLDLKRVRVISESPHHVKIIFSTLSAGPYTGDLTFYIFDGSPLLQMQSALVIDRPWVAYLYDALLYADFKTVAYQDTNGLFQTSAASVFSEPVPGEAAGVKAKHRVIFGEVAGGTGTLAMMLPPHAGLYPLDFSINCGFLQAGQGFIGTKMSYWGDRRYVPWIDAPIGSTQRMDVFILISALKPELALARVLAYTHGDFYKPLPGHYTMAEHFHPEFTQAFLNGKDTLTSFKETMKSVGVQILQPMEFHGSTGHAHTIDSPDDRLAELHTMFTLFQKASDGNFLLIPGEEYNEFFGGHWSYLFPHPVYFTGWHGQGNKPYKLTNVVSGGVTYPVVYQIGDAASMSRLLQDEGGVAWASHPRVKDSLETPDRYVDSDFYRSTNFLAGDWKAMPADLSQDRLGFRSFQLMDDTAQWGYRKSMLGEVDTFELNPTHEIYGNLNVNYLELLSLPSPTNWSSVVDCVRKGRFFTTTGELLIHSWRADKSGVTATVEWYFPPAFAEITWGDAGGVHKQKLSLANETEFSQKTITIAADLADANWVRFEIWDVARDGAFTQPFWLREPANPALVSGTATSFTLINADTDAPVAGYDPIPPQAVLHRAKLPANLTIRANVSPLIIGEVVINFDGVKSLQAKWPYCLTTCTVKRGIRGSPFYDYAPSDLSPGDHVITATPSEKGVTGQPLTLKFSCD